MSVPKSTDKRDSNGRKVPARATGYTELVIEPGPDELYVILSNDTARDPDLSDQARGLLVRMRSNRTGWKTSIENLARTSNKDGRQRVTTSLNELMERGYVLRERIQEEDGRFLGFRYRVFDRPQTPRSDPESGNPTTGVTSGFASDGPLSGNRGMVPTSKFAANSQVAPIIGFPVDGESANKEDQYQKDQEQEDQEDPAVPGARSAVTQVGPASGGAGAAPKITPAQRKGFRTALRATLKRSSAAYLVLPGILPGLLPNSLPDAYAEALAERTPQQIAARIDRRWSERWAHHATMGTLQSPIGVALDLLARPECPDVRCEDGANVDTGAPCPRCIERAADRRGTAVGGDQAPGVSGDEAVGNGTGPQAPARTTVADAPGAGTPGAPAPSGRGSDWAAAIKADLNRRASV